MNINNWA